METFEKELFTYIKDRDKVTFPDLCYNWVIISYGNLGSSTRDL